VFCSRCGHQVNDAARFCPSCGLDLATATPVKTPSAVPSGERTEADVIHDALKAEYEIIEELGRGGMAIVFRARERQLEREVALKVLPFSLAFDAEFVERFQREARTAARLEHPNIIPIYRVGRAARVTYIVMKLLRGQALSEQLERRGRLPPAEIRNLLIQAAGALGYAHKHGIVHRDVKPDNIMFDELGHAVVTDFGIAKAASGTRLTGTGMSIGTPHYMSPEQARAQPLDGRSDLYSLGVVAYQCLVGQVPFDGEDAFSIGYKHIMEALPAPELDTVEQRRMFVVIRRMMAKAPEDRFQTAEDLVQELEMRPSLSALGEDLQSAPTLTMTPYDASQVAGLPRPTAPAGRLSALTTPTTPVPRAEPPVRRRGGVLAVASLAVLLGGGGVGGYYIYRTYYAPGPAPAMATVALPDSLPPLDSASRAARDSAARVDSLAQVEAARLAALPDTGWLVVRGAPAGARFFIGETPYQDSILALGLNSYGLRVTAAGYNDFTYLVTISKVESTFVDAKLTRVAVAQAPVPPRPPVARPRPPARRDTAATAGAQCERPGQPGYNAGQLCFDAPPRLLGEAIVPLDESVTATPQPVSVLVRVSVDGRALMSAPSNRALRDPFMTLAVLHARRQRYEPATKNGRPVEAWWQFRFFPQSR
jgi:serine/threonine protein kinase